MKLKWIICIALLFFLNAVYGQSKIDFFKEFYNNADTTCYMQRIQKDIDSFDAWLKDSVPLLSHGMQPWYEPANIDLKKENKIFALAISLVNTENYRFEDNIYDYLVIDSTRTFIIVTVDNKMNVTGITDISDIGSYQDVKSDLYYLKKKKKKRVRELIKNINKQSPDLIMYLDELSGTFLFIKGDKIFVYDPMKGEGQEFNEHVKEHLQIDFVRRLNQVSFRYKNWLKGDYSDPSFYRLTGNTPPDELRICE